MAGEEGQLIGAFFDLFGDGFARAVASPCFDAHQMRHRADVGGLQGGERIVVDGTGKLRPGMQITEGTVQEAKAQQADEAAPAGDTQ